MEVKSEVKNEDIRAAAKSAGVRHWQIAEKLGVTASWFSVELRHELSKEKKSEIFRIIAKIAEAAA